MAVCVGWGYGYDEDDIDLIHSESQPEFVVVAGIRVWTSDDLRTDISFLSYPYYDFIGEYDDTITIPSNATESTFKLLAKKFIKDYNFLINNFVVIDNMGHLERK